MYESKIQGVKIGSEVYLNADDLLQWLGKYRAILSGTISKQVVGDLRKQLTAVLNKVEEDDALGNIKDRFDGESWKNI